MDKRLKKYRCDLHQIPELQFDLFKTSLYIKTELTQMGFELYPTAKTGWIAYKKGKLDTAIAFRSDMDGLPVSEKSDHPTPSMHQGNMHACGHDGHMAMLLGFAYAIKDIDLQGQSIVLIFQPAEEFPGGAKVIIKEGMLDKFKVEKIFGIHLYPGLKQGMYGVVKGPMMARNGEFDLTMTGKSAHGAQPYLGNDVIVASSQLISQFQTIISRNIDPFDQSVLTVGTIKGGEARNIIAQEVKISGTIRAFKDSVYNQIKDRMEKMIQGIKLGFDLEIDYEMKDFYPVVYNDETLVDQVIKNLDKDSYVFIQPMMFAEDFAFYQQKVPGMFTMLGTKNEIKGYTHPLHSCYFNFDEAVLIKGVELYLSIARSYNLI